MTRNTSRQRSFITWRRTDLTKVNFYSQQCAYIKDNIVLVLFGTNFPQLNLEKTLKNVDTLGLSQEVKDKFLWKNACKVFKLDLPSMTSRL